MTEPLNSICMVLIGVVITLAGIWFTHVKNAINRDELNETESRMLGEVERSRSSFASLLSANQQIMTGMGKDIQRIQMDVALLKQWNERRDSRDEMEM